MRYRRTRTGCLTCRSRRKKCDEVQPRCAGCRRNQLPCDWPTESSSERRSRPSDSTTASTVSINDCCPFKSPVISTRANILQRHNVSAITIAPPVSSVCRGANSQDQRACLLTPQSVTLLSHFLMHTAASFATGSANDNPFVTLLVPLASTDDLLMHALLAVSGAQLASKDPTLAVSGETSRAARLHYSKLISGLLEELSSLAEDDLEKKERLLRLLMVACHYEAVSGNTNGALFSHLRASRHLVTSLVHSRSEENHLWHSNSSYSTLGFSIELYTYIMITNSMVLHLDAYHPFPADVFVMPLDEMSRFPTFGSMFTGAHELYSLVPEISHLASLRLAEEAAGSAEPSAALQCVHDRLLGRVKAWKMTEPSGPADQAHEMKKHTAEAVRHAVHIFLATALAGSIVPEEARRSSLMCHAGMVFHNMRKAIDSQKAYTTTLLWPAVVGGSCIIKPESLEALLGALRGDWPGTRHTRILADVLQLMWNDPDPRAYGPYGLKMIMQKYDKVVGVV